MDSCRLCGSRARVFDLYDDIFTCGDNLRTYIYLSTGVQIRKEDEMTTCICEACLTVILNMFLFRKKALKHDMKLRGEKGMRDEAFVAKSLQDVLDENHRIVGDLRGYLQRSVGIQVDFCTENGKKRRLVEKVVTREEKIEKLKEVEKVKSASFLKLKESFPNLKFPKVVETENLFPRVYLNQHPKEINAFRRKSQRIFRRFFKKSVPRRPDLPKNYDDLELENRETLYFSSLELARTKPVGNSFCCKFCINQSSPQRLIKPCGFPGKRNEGMSAKRAGSFSKTKRLAKSSCVRKLASSPKFIETVGSVPRKSGIERLKNGYGSYQNFEEEIAENSGSNSSETRAKTTFPEENRFSKRTKFSVQNSAGDSFSESEGQIGNFSSVPLGRLQRLSVDSSKNRLVPRFRVQTPFGENRNYPENSLAVQGSVQDKIQEGIRNFPSISSDLDQNLSNGFSKIRRKSQNFVTASPFPIFMISRSNAENSPVSDPVQIQYPKSDECSNREKSEYFSRISAIPPSLSGETNSPGSGCSENLERNIPGNSESLIEKVNEQSDGFSKDIETAQNESVPKLKESEPFSQSSSCQQSEDQTTNCQEFFDSQEIAFLQRAFRRKSGTESAEYRIVPNERKSAEEIVENPEFSKLRPRKYKRISTS